MSMPFYVSPEQVMKDKADYARKGIARGRAVVVVAHAEGIAFVSENASRALHKISEIYDRVAFAAVGKYNEFENLRVAGVRYADVRGYSYDRSDVTGGRYEEHSFHSVGSGSTFARSALKKRYRDDVDEAGAIKLAVDALYDAADDDSATGGPDLTRRIWPVVMTVTDEGARRLPEPEVGVVVEVVVAERMQNPGG